MFAITCQPCVVLRVAAAWALGAFVAAGARASEPLITTVAGGGPDNLPAAAANIWAPVSVAVDPSGGFVVVSQEAHRIYRIDAGMRLSILVGADGQAGFSGDGGPSAGARIKSPDGAAIDGVGNLYFSDAGNQRVRRVDAATGNISTVAGDGTAGFGGDNGPALSARLNKPRGLAVDAAGNLYIADSLNTRIRRIDASSGIIATVVGTGFGTGSIDGQGGDPRDDLGDGGPAANASLRGPVGLALDAAGDLLIADPGNVRIRRVDAATGIITTVAGNGVSTGSIDGVGGNPADDLGDGRPATSASLSNPAGVAAGFGGDLIVADTGNRRVRRVSGSTGVIETIAGGATSPLGDGGPATAAGLGTPLAACFDANADLLIADRSDNRVRGVDHATGIISTIAGNGYAFFSGEGAPAISAWIRAAGFTIDGAGNIFVADPQNSRVRRIDAGTGAITTVAGSGFQDNTGDGGPAVAAGVRDPWDVALDAAGNIYIANQFAPVIRKVDAATGIISTVAGTGVEGFSGDGGPATLAAINRPVGLAVDGPGNIFIADRHNGRIRRVDAATGIITTIAGTGAYGFGGDGGPATAAVLGLPVDVTLDGAGNLFISDQCNHRIRRIDRQSGLISTVAGGGPGAQPGDGCRTVATGLRNPWGIRIDAAGNLFVADLGGAVVRRIDALSGTMTTIAGNGVFEFAGDGGPATSASLLGPGDVAVDAAGNVIIADTVRLRRVGQDSPPVASAGPDVQEECSSPAGSLLHLDGSGSIDPDSSPGTNDGILAYEWYRNYALPSQTWLGSGPLADATLSLGDSTVTLRVVGRGGLSAVDAVELRVRDTTPPLISLGITPADLWPPNHRLVAVTAAGSASDACGDASVVLESVASTEPDDDPGTADGSTPGDIRDADTGVADFAFLLRAERSGTGGGRAYTVTYRAVDGAGNSGAAAAQVNVPHDGGGETDPLSLQVDHGPSGTVLTWTAVSSAVAYNVIRARLVNVVRTAEATSLGEVLCLAAGTVATSALDQQDPIDPPVGEAFLYFVEYQASAWTGYGSESSPLPLEAGPGDCL